MTTDIVVMTCERLDLLKRTLEHIWARTKTQYRLHIIDDASTTGNADYIRGLLQEGRIYNAVLREARAGIPAALHTALQITKSDPLVITDDDILCPRLEPDWLARGLAEMEDLPQLGVLAMNNPQSNVGDKGQRLNRRRARAVNGGVTICRNVGGTFAFVRRAVLRDFTPPPRTEMSFKTMCINCRRDGWLVGYLTDVYCQHLGIVSVRMRRKIDSCFHNVLPLNPETLIPAEQYRG